MSNHSEFSYGQRDNVLLPQRTRLRLQKEVINLIKKPPQGIHLVVDSETGLPPSFTELVVSNIQSVP